MAAAGLFQMSPYQWTNAAGLSMQGLQLAGQMAAAHDKKIVQKTTTKKSGGSGLGGALGGIVGTVGGAMLGGPMGAAIGGALGGGLGGGIDGGSAGAATGLAGGFGFGSQFGTSELGGMFANLLGSGTQAQQQTGGGNTWDNGYKGFSVGDAMSLKYGPLGGMFK